MWRRWTKSAAQNPPSSNSSFSSTSFKDIQNLISDDSPPPSPIPTSKFSSVIHRVRLANAFFRSLSAPQSDSDSGSSPPPPPPPPPPQTQQDLQPPSPPPSNFTIPGAEKQIVLYHTSLGVVRSTSEDCRFVQTILRAFRVSIEERDLAMDSRFIKELKQIFGGGGGGQRKLTLPCVFIGGRYIGGADEIRDLHDAGELKKFVMGLPVADRGACEVCGDYRFVLCNVCNGSHKLYIENFGFMSCSVCNENGLIRCPSCCSSPTFCSLT
ncbi:Glutaredoxin family protein [Euphorbia peplus]|nr:Glutaredoxin family protein [Euphorbia peplus]